MIVEVVATETRESLDFIGEIEILVFEKLLPAFGGADFLEEGFHRGGIDGGIFEGDECAGIADFWWQADGQMEIGTSFFDHLVQE